MVPLPFVDEHAIRIAAPVERSWREVRRFRDRSLARPAPWAFRKLVRLDPASGFAIANATAPSQLVLVGRHRFSDYELTFEVARDGDGTLVTARTSAAFPGLGGATYRALVIGSGGHAVVVRSMLRRIRRAAERTSFDA